MLAVERVVKKMADEHDIVPVCRAGAFPCEAVDLGNFGFGMAFVELGYRQ